MKDAVTILHDESVKLPTQETVSTPPLRQRHLLYLDGLRGVAALFVVVHHAYMEVIAERTPVIFASPLRQMTGWLYYGQIAVDIFIVLSGYCLMLPVVASGGRLRGGVVQYHLRRARRILPSYYVTLLLSLLVVALIPGMSQPSGFRWDAALPALNTGAIVSHLLLVHNLNNQWIHRIDPPMWSVATEWQIYFLFPLILLPVWRKAGNVALIGVAFLLGLLPHFAFNKGDGVCPWFLGLFALGAAAATFSTVTSSASVPLIRRSSVVALIALVLFVGRVATSTLAQQWESLYLLDTLAGIATAALLVCFTTHCYEMPQKSPPFLLWLFQSRLALWLGSFSYSLYLVHFPVLSLLHLWLRTEHLSATKVFLWLATVGVGLSIVVSYVFYILIERRFLPYASKKKTATVQAATDSLTSPAP